MAATLYDLKTVEKLISDYVGKHAGDVTELEEGVLGYGTTLLHNGDKVSTIVIKEVYINAWSSGHSIRQYKKIPKKYEKLLGSIK